MAMRSHPERSPGRLAFGLGILVRFHKVNGPSCLKIHTKLRGVTNEEHSNFALVVCATDLVALFVRSCPGQNGDGSETGFLQAHLMQRLDTGFDQGAVHDLWALLCVLDQTPEHALKLGRGVKISARSVADCTCLAVVSVGVPLLHYKGSNSNTERSAVMYSNDCNQLISTICSLSSMPG